MASFTSRSDVRLPDDARGRLIAQARQIVLAGGPEPVRLRIHCNRLRKHLLSARTRPDQYLVQKLNSHAARLHSLQVFLLPPHLREAERHHHDDLAMSLQAQAVLDLLCHAVAIFQCDDLDSGAEPAGRVSPPRSVLCQHYRLLAVFRRRSGKFLAARIAD